MTGPLLIALPGNDALADALVRLLDGERGRVELRSFPDGETYLRYEDAVAGRNLVLVCTLDRPNEKFLPLLFAASTARALSAASVGLVAPYLAYMRQDKQFKPGEAVTSTVFAESLSRHVDWLVTVDPHLHRRSGLDEIYGVPAAALHAAPLLSAWIAANVTQPILIGPDGESEQWVAAVACDAKAPYVVLEKTRRGDRDVIVSVPEVERWRNHTPVLVDDIVSTGRTMIETIGHLAAAGMKPPVCIAVHGVFADRAFQDLRDAGAARIVTSNTIAHETNGIDVTALIADGVRRLSPRR